ncbi:MAG: signal peptidase II [Anaerolineae bacterium]|nr:signal peptidase II [Anaerolineae bacterium]
MKQRANYLLLLAIAAAVILLDQLTKALVVANLGLHEQFAPVEALRPYFTFTYVRNTGAAFGLFPSGGMIFIVVALVVTVMIVYFYRTIPDQTPLMRAALGLQLGGAWGNLIDRLRLGYVVDFLDFKFWPVFNVADSAIVVGVLVLLAAMWWQERQAARAGDDDTSPSPLE